MGCQETKDLLGNQEMMVFQDHQEIQDLEETQVKMGQLDQLAFLDP